MLLLSEIDTKKNLEEDFFLYIVPLYIFAGQTTVNLESHSNNSSFLNIFTGVTRMEHYRAVSGPFGYSDHKSILA